MKEANVSSPQLPDRMNSFLTTEHFTLQSARGMINSEIANRVLVYFTSLSSTLIAAAFLAQVSGMDQVFQLFTAIAFPLILIFGIFTLARLIMLSTMDMVYVRAINRIRQFYVQAAPETADFLLFPPYDDDVSVRKYAGYSTSVRGNLISTGNIINLTNSTVGTVLVGMYLSRVFDLSALQFLPYGVGILIVFLFLHGALGLFLIKEDFYTEYIQARYPDPSAEKPIAEND
jgi:hypothetical protein